MEIEGRAQCDAAPELQLIDAQTRADGVAYHLRLHSARGAPEIELAIPPALKLQSASLLDGAQRLPARFWRAPDGTGWLDLIGSPLTDAGTLTERFRRPTFAVMEIYVTVEDTKAYTRPFTVRLYQELMLGDELIEYVCLENQRFKG